ncbi:hypothetical protein SDRG_16665, partial [Saprolegnia diclina VS20]
MASCKYSDLALHETALVADGSCGGNAMCFVNSNCSVVRRVANASTRVQLEASDVLGDVFLYRHATLELVNLTKSHINHQFPVQLAALSLVGANFEDLDDIDVPPEVLRLTLTSCHFKRAISLYGFRALQHLELRSTRSPDLFVWDSCPSTLRNLTILDCGRDNFSYLTLPQIETLELDNVRTLYGLRVSFRLRRFACYNCSFDYFSVDSEDSLRALRNLSPTSSSTSNATFQVPPFTSDCTRSDTTQARLWDNAPDYVLCVNHKSYTWTIEYKELYHFLYIALGILAAGILLGCLYRRGQRVAKTDRAADDDYLVSSLSAKELETLQMLQLDASSLVVS